MKETFKDGFDCIYKSEEINFVWMACLHKITALKYFS